MEAALPMNPRVEAVETLPNFQLLVTFTSGEHKRFDMKPYIERGGVFSELSDPAYFAQVHSVRLGVRWPNEQDVSFNTLYVLGEPIPTSVL